MSEARIHTRSFEFPRKLYQIGPMGLKDGLEVDFLKIGGLFLLAWFAALTLLFGLPTQATFPLYVTIPVVIVYWGFTPDPKHARRRRLVAWMLAVRYALVGHIPIVAGRRAGERGGVLTPRERIDVAAWWRTRVLHKDDEHLWESATKGARRPFPAGQPITPRVEVRLYSFEHMQTVRNRRHV